MRACSTVVSVPSPTLCIYSRTHPVLPEEKVMKQRLDNDHENRPLKKSALDAV
jgi:hypothetical protein